MRPVVFSEALAVVVETLAAECGCRPDDLTDGSVHLFEQPLGDRPPLARRYWSGEPTFTAVSFGRGAALVASATILDDLTEHFRDADRDQVFAPEWLSVVSRLLRPSGRAVYGPYPRLLCGADTVRRREAPPGFTVRIEVAPPDARLDELEPARWPNAISPRRTVPTAALVVARRGRTVVGVAAASLDSERLWQIGIDVAQSYRGRGIGAALTSALARQILDVGGVPFYGAAPANLPSINTALAAGFRLAWLEVFTAAAGRW